MSGATNIRRKCCCVGCPPCPDACNGVQPAAVVSTDGSCADDPDPDGSFAYVGYSDEPLACRWDWDNVDGWSLFIVWWTFIDESCAWLIGLVGPSGDQYASNVYTQRDLACVDGELVGTVALPDNSGCEGFTATVTFG